MLARLSVLATIWGKSHQWQLPRMEPPLFWIATHGYLLSALRSELLNKPHPLVLLLCFHSWKNKRRVRRPTYLYRIVYRIV